MHVLTTVVLFWCRPRGISSLRLGHEAFYEIRRKIQSASTVHTLRSFRSGRAQVSRILSFFQCAPGSAFCLCMYDHARACTRKRLSVHAMPDAHAFFVLACRPKQHKNLTKMFEISSFSLTHGWKRDSSVYCNVTVLLALVRRGSMSGGHYVGYVKHESGQWYECDDTNVTPVPESQVKK